MDTTFTSVLPFGNWFGIYTAVSSADGWTHIFIDKLYLGIRKTNCFTCSQLSAE